MAQNSDDFLIDRSTNRIADHSLAAGDKYLELERASNQKIAELEKYRIKQAAHEKAVAGSVAGQWGLNPNDNFGALVNRGVATATGIANSVGVVGAGAANEVARFNRSSVDMPVREAYQRQQMGRATPADLELLSAPGSGSKLLSDADVADRFAKKLDGRRAEIASMVAPDRDGVKPTGLGQMAVDAGLSLANGAIAVPEAVVGIASIVSGGAAGKYLEEAGFRPAEAKEFINSLKSAELQAANASVTGADGFWNTLDQVAANPSTVPHLLLESLFPMLAGGVAARGLQALGAGVKLATAAGEGVTMAGSAAEQIRGQTEDKRLTLKQSLAAATTGVMGGAVARLSGGVSGKLGLGDIDEAITKGTLGTSQRGVLTRTVGSTAFEAGEEGLQSTGETMLQNFALDKALTEGVGNAAALGMVTGAAMGAPMGLAKGVGEAKQRYQDTAALQDKAIASGDVTALADPAARTYAPEMAIAALTGNAQLATTTEEAKQAHLIKADDIADVLNVKREGLATELATNTLKGVSTKIAQMQERLTNTDPAKTQLVTAITTNLATLQEQLVSLQEDKTDGKRTKSLEKEMAALDTQIEGVNTAKTQLNQLVQGGTGVEAMLTSLSTPVDQADPVAVKAAAETATRVVNLAMSAPQLLDPVRAEAVAADMSNALTAPQREVLREFSKARLEQNLLISTGGVSLQIYKGGDGNVGIEQYQQRMNRALKAGNVEQAQKQLDGLSAFEADHRSKAEVAAAAMDKGPGIQIIKANGQWKIGDGSLPQSKMRPNGALTINSPGLVKTIQQEAAALTASLSYLTKAYEQKFNAPAADASTLTGATNVPNTSQQGQGTQVQSKTAATKDAAPTGSPATASEGVPTTAGTTGDVQAAGVAESTTVEAELATVTEETSVSSVKTDSTGVDKKTEQTQKTQSTEKTADITVETQSNSENSTAGSETAQTVASDGKLSALQQTSPEGTPHDEKKLGDFFTQELGKDTDGSTRPLVAVKNFMAAVAAGTVKIGQYIKDQDLSKGSKPMAWAKFVEKTAQWAPIIARNLKVGTNAKFNYTDPMRYLIQASSVNGKSRIDVEENVKTAMSAAVFGYVADLASRAAGNSDKAINSTLGHRPDSPISADARAALTDVGAYQSQVIDSLGSAVIDALGFKIDVNAPQDMLAKLQVSLGAHAFKLMEDRGLLVRTSFTNGEINTLRNEDLFADNEAENQTEEATQVSDNLVGHHFFKLARDEAGQPNGEAKEIADSIKGSQSLIQNLFGIESGLSFPSLTPIKGVQKQSATGMGLPGFVKRVFKLNQTRPWKANKDPLKVLSFFSEEEGMEMAGVEAASEHTHVRNRNSKRAKNDGLIREFRNVMGFFGDLAIGEKGMDQEFFLSQDMWKQQRSGYKTNTVNPNTSKIVRWLIAPDSWSTVIDLNNKAQFQSFMLRASEGFGIKPEKAASQKSVDDLDSMMQAPAMKAAVKALQAVLFTDNAVLSAEQQGAIKAAVKTGNQKLHTLASLIAYANYQQAMDTKATTFTTNLMGEVDGVSNGSILNAIMYGAAATSDQLNTLLQKGGIYALSSKFQQYNLWRGTPGHQDIYESNAQDLHAYVNSMPVESRTVTDAIWATAGSPINAALEASKDGRDLLKGPINPLNYGGGFTSIIGKMAYDYVDAMYEKLEGFSRKGSDQSTVDVFVSNVNVLLSSEGATRLPVNKPISYYLNHSLTKSQEAALRNAYSETIGAAAKEVVGTNFKPFLKRSKLVTQTANLAYGLYEAVYTASRNAMIEELGIPMTKAGPIHDLSKTQEAELAERLKDILPAMHTAMSKDEGNISSGILLAKKGRKQNNSSAYKVEVTFGSKLKNNASQLTSSGRSVVQEDPGVIAISGTTHALDSAISLDAQGTNHVVNNHDAVGAGINTLAKSADSLNKSTWSRTLNYSPLNEAHDALMRVVHGITEMDQRGELTPEIQTAIKEMLQKLAKKNRVSQVESLLDTTVFGIFNEALAANKVKFGAMSQWAVVDQYAMDGGSYTVTKEDRNEASDNFNALSHVRAEADLQALDNFASTIFGAWAVRDAPDAQPADAPKKATLTSVFGPLGTPKIAPDTDLVKFFAANPEASFKRVLQGLLRKVKTDGVIPNPLFHDALIHKLIEKLDPELKVMYITKDSSADLPINGPVMGARGWFAINGSKQEIYVLSPEFVDSGLDTELLIHEMVHAALSNILQSTDEAVQPFIAELKQLLGKAQTTVNGDAKLKAKFGNAVANLDELLAWGMTNQAFQIEVLAKIKMQSTTLGKMANGVQTFVSNLAKLLGFKDAASADGLGVLIANVSALFEQVAKTMPVERKQDPVNLTMATPVTSGAAPSQQAGLNKYSTLDLHDALKDGKLSVNFANQVRGLLSNIVEKLHGPFGSLSASLMEQQALSAEDVWLKALNTGEAPFASQILGSGFVVPDQSMFAIEQVEATVRATLTGKEVYSKTAYKVLYDLYTEVSKKIKVEDFHTGSPWSQATTAEQAAAQALHDFVFKIEGGIGQRSDYLSRFAAMGLAHEGFNKLLQVATDSRRTVASAKSFADRLQAIFEGILAFWSTKVTGTYKGQQADQKLTALVGQLVDIEAKRRYKLAHPRTSPLADAIEDKSKAVSDALRSKISKLAGAPAVSQNSYAVVRAAGALVQTVADNRVELFMDNLRTIRNSAFKGKLGVIASALGELQGPAKALQALLRLSKWMEGNRKDLITNSATYARAGFANQGRGMSGATKAAISQVFLRTGLHHLVGKFSMSEIAGLVSNTTELNAAMATYEAKLNSFGKAKYYFIEQANALGIEVATGAVRGEFQMMNAHNIASLYGTAYQGKLNAARTAEAKEAIEVLVALYALGYTDSAARLDAGIVMVAENQRTDGNGVEAVLKLHKQLEKESIDRLFKGRPELMMHGYLPEIYDPNIEVKAANAADGQDLINLGYTKGAQVVLDRADPDRSVRHMYIRDGGGMARRVTGVTSWKSMNSKGTENHSGYTNTNTFTGAQNAAANADLMASRQQAIADMFQPGPRRDLSKVKANHMAPVLNEQGDIVKWRYMMANTTKDSVLNRDNRFDQLLGSLAGSVYDKETSREQNKTAFTALKAQYDADYAKNPQAYVLVGQGAVDKDMKEIWDLLPADSKADARAIWGYDGMMVKNDALDIMFGYRKASLANMFEKDPQLRNALEKVFVGVMETVLSQQGRVFKGMSPDEAEGYAKRAAIMVTRGEKVWQELVSEVKDILVVKTGLVMMGNIYSNLSLLWLSGVPIKDILHHHLVALKGATSYKRDSAELAQLTLLRDTGYMQGKDAEVNRRIARLEDNLANNPVKELIDAGLMPTIVEDLAADEDIYSYKSDFVRSVSKFTDKLNPKLVSAARVVYMAHDTQLYQGLSRVTQLSDFVARYTLYQHNISKRNPMSKEEAIQDASDAFINYDIPMHQSLQYMDDMGLLPFTKYFLRIQKVLSKLFMDNPGRVLMAMSVGQLMDLGPIVLESSMFGRIGNNPLDVGPFKLFTVMDDIATINAALSIVKQ